MSDRDLIAEGRELLLRVAPGPSMTPDPWTAYEWVRRNLPALLDALEAAQRPPLGYVVGRKTSEGWWTFNRFYGGPEPVRAGAEHSLAGTIEEDGPEAGWQLLEVREVQP